MKEASPATPVILLTGWGRRLVADNDIPLNVDPVLAKPPKLREALVLHCRSGETKRGIGSDSGVDEMINRKNDD